MKKIIPIALITVVGLLASVVYAQTQNDENIKADVQTLDKDNAALAKKQETLKRDRVAKANDKANDDNGKQAVDSMKIGVDKMGIEAKTIEKHMDEKTLAKHKDAINQDNAGKN